MTNQKVQRRALAGSYSQLRNVPPQGVRVQHDGSPLCGRRNTGNHEVRTDSFMDAHVRSARLGNVGGQFRKERFQVGSIRRHRHMGSIRIGGPVVQRTDIQPVRTDQTDAVNDDPLGSGRSGHRGRRRAGGGIAVRKHDHDLGVGRGGIKQLDRFAKGVGVIGAAAGSQALYRGFQRVNGGGQLRIRRRLCGRC